jgi:hypothetical protein
VLSSEVTVPIGDIAWPVTVLLILVVLLREFKAILQALQTRIGDPHTSVKLTSRGLELSGRVEALEGTVETQQLKADVLASAVVAHADRAAAGRKNPTALAHSQSGVHCRR